MSKYEFEDGGHGDFLGSTNENLVDDDDCARTNILFPSIPEDNLQN